jgi:hypothetical protein
MNIILKNLVPKSIFTYDVVVNDKKVGVLSGHDVEKSFEVEAASDGKVAINLSIFSFPLSNTNIIYLQGPLQIDVKRNIPIIVLGLIVLVLSIYLLDMHPNNTIRYIRFGVIILACLLSFFSRKLILIDSNNNV